MKSSSYLKRATGCIVLLTSLGLAACSSNTSSSTSKTTVAQTVVVVSQADTPSRILTEVYALALQNSGLRVARRDPVPDFAAGLAALSTGAADFFVTDTGTLLTYMAANEPAASSTSSTAIPTTTELATTTTAQATTTTTTVVATTTTTPSAGPTTSVAGGATSTTGIDSSTTTTVPTAGQAEAVSVNLQTKQIGEILPSTLQVGAAANAESKDVIACTGGAATTGQLSTLSDVAQVAGGLRLAATADFATGDPFGAAGFKKVYGQSFKQIVTVTADKVASTMTSGGAECGAFNSLDTSIATDMVVMGDDKGWIPSHGFIPLVNTTAYTPSVSQVTDQVSQSLSTTSLRNMIHEVTITKTAINLVAANYLAAAGITGK